MNAWLLAALIIVIVAVVIFVGCILAVIIPLKNTVTVLLTHVQGIQKQLEGIQTETTALIATIDKMKTDVTYKKKSILAVVQSVKDTGAALNEVNESSQAAAMAVMKHVSDDPEKQAQIAQWTNTAMGFLNRQAQ